VRYRWPLVCLAALSIAGCHRPSPAEQAAQAARDVAQVEAVQHIHPPVQPIQPQPIDPRVRDLIELTRAGCDFRPDGGRQQNPVLVAGRYKAVLLVDGRPIVLAADSGSGELRAGVRRKYTGRTHWAELAAEPGAQPSEGAWPGRLVIRDRWDRVVFAASGLFDCRA
jgi:hypothetical protein